MRLGYNTWSTPSLAFSEAVDLLAGLGYDSIEVTVCEGWPTDAMRASSTDAIRWRRQAHDAGLEISSVTANAPLVCDAQTWVTSRERLVRSFELAGVLDDSDTLPVSLGAHRPKARLLGGAPPPIVAQHTWNTDRQLIIDRFAELTELARQAGVRIAVEPHSGAVLSDAKHARELLAAVESPRLGINLDISHFAARGLDVHAVVQDLLPHTLVVEVKDHVRTEHGFDFLIPGEGDFDYPQFLGLLHGGGYPGAVSVEISVRRQALPGFDAAAAAKQSYAVLDAAFHAAGVVRPAHQMKGSP